MTEEEKGNLIKHVNEFPLRDKLIHDLINSQVRQTAEVKKVADEVRNEWASLKKYAFGALIAGMVSVFGYGAYIKGLSSDMENNKARITSAEIKIDAIDKQQQASNITLAEIRTQLLNINTTLVEIKNSIKYQQLPVEKN
jgi:Tfp pilus assembly protein PilO